MATMQTQNVTELMKNYVFLIEDDIDVNFMQECKLKEGDRNKVEGFFKDKDYDLTCGPSNCQTKKSRAGVGCASRKGNAEVITPKHLTKAFEDAWNMGRKYLVDLGWEKMIVVYNIYGQSGGSKEDKAVTEAIIAAIRAENDQEQHLPTIIMGDIIRVVIQITSPLFIFRKQQLVPCQDPQDQDRDPKGQDQDPIDCP